MCVKLVSSNVDSFYVFDNMVCLKIYNDTAVLPTNCIHPYDSFDNRSAAILNATYVMVNVNSNDQINIIIGVR